MSGAHVGYVLKVYPRLSETFIVNEILELERRGVRITVFSLRLPQEGRFHEKLARVGAEVVYLPTLTTHDFLEFVSRHAEALAPVRGRLGRALWDILASGDVRRMKLFSKAVALHLAAREHGVQHLHAHFATSSTAVAALASEFSDIPFSFTAHAKDIYLDAHDYGQVTDRIRRARFVVTVCDANLRHLRRLAPDATNVHRIYNGLDLEEFGVAPRRANAVPRILGVGRLVPKKGFDTLLQACALLVRREVPFRCRIVGDGAERERLEAMIAALDLNDAVELAGPLPNESVRRMISESDVMALPARIAQDGNRDALPTVLLESLALETPVISTPVTGIPEIVGDEAGAIVPSDDADALADALQAFLQDPDRQRRCGRAGRRRLELLFDVRRNVAELFDRFLASTNPAADADPKNPRTPTRRDEVLHAARLR